MILMLVRCPKCRTTYKVSDEVVKGNSPAFRCSRCKHTFELDPASVPENLKNTGQAGAAAAEPRTDEELKLPFEAKAAEHSADQTGNAGSPDAQPSNAERIVHRDPQEDLSLILPEKDPLPERPGGAHGAEDFPEDDLLFPKADSDSESGDSNNILALSSYLDQRASVLPFATLFGVLLVAFTLITVISYAHPQASEAVLKQIPWLGSSLLKNEHLKEAVVVKSLRFGYQTIQGNREVFLISGIVLNQNPVTVQEIRLSGVTYNHEGKELERQTIWAGNTISPKIIRGMTSEDIPHLQNLKPLKSFEIAAGDSVPFTIVFLRSAKRATQFSCEVLSAESEL